MILYTTDAPILIITYDNNRKLYVFINDKKKYTLLSSITTKALVLEIKSHKNRSHLMPEAVSPTSF